MMPRHTSSAPGSTTTSGTTPKPRETDNWPSSRSDDPERGYSQTAGISDIRPSRRPPCRWHNQDVADQQRQAGRTQHTGRPAFITPASSPDRAAAGHFLTIGHHSAEHAPFLSRPARPRIHLPAIRAPTRSSGSLRARRASGRSSVSRPTELRSAYSSLKSTSPPSTTHASSPCRSRNPATLPKAAPTSHGLGNVHRHR